MSNKILMVGALACLSAVAVAQADQSKDKAPAQDQVAAPRDTASGQASAKRMHKPISVTAEVGVQDAAASKPTGKTAMDDWQAPAAKTSQQPKITENNKSRVAAGDVNEAMQRVKKDGVWVCRDGDPRNRLHRGRVEDIHDIHLATCDVSQSQLRIEHDAMHRGLG